MYLAPLTLVGFGISMICASVCPMNMKTMDMNGGTHMMGRAMQVQHGGERDMACERCEQRGGELAFASAVAVSAPSGVLQTAAAFYAIHPIVSIPFKQGGALFSNAGPPLLGDLLVGTVVLRT